MLLRRPAFHSPQVRVLLSIFQMPGKGRRPNAGGGQAVAPPASRASREPPQASRSAVALLTAASPRSPSRVASSSDSCLHKSFRLDAPTGDNSGGALRTPSEPQGGCGDCPRGQSGSSSAERGSTQTSSFGSTTSSGANFLTSRQTAHFGQDRSLYNCESDQPRLPMPWTQHSGRSNSPSTRL
jgi:hypothetical protein